jgi:hypothetical protein
VGKRAVHGVNVHRALQQPRRFLDQHVIRRAAEVLTFDIGRTNTAAALQLQKARQLNSVRGMVGAVVDDEITARDPKLPAQGA